MGWLNSMQISATGLSAQRLRMNVIANNIANAQTTRTAQGGPYRREIVQLKPMQSGPQQSFAGLLSSSQGQSAAGAGVQVSGIIKDPSPFKQVYDPSSPDAVNGYVQMPNVNISTEMVDMISASRAYQANVTAFAAGKQMYRDALTLGQ
ncbi:flagellar basal body rod protein FlgC [Alicyclobacillus sp. SO9]|uniref:flagellar basal body rod protein FlgC n=1 Tax=Alicyclobacillus sp. SO9 TaxID=2665646 RepID=UPI0018E8102D|nr:flagellar basal body rod protein FlgC [Alicyclobacillus sp. SO9]QQE80801.1 flagellar basal body rod protein FlgC [Alicyclobacillus sp. SO9]